jgi:serine phosphatase RsbU (regulator of sigma subunit)
MFSVFIFRSLNITRKQKIIIEEKNKIVEEKNKDMLDSINYAQRIQEAILIPESEIQKHFADAFVLFKPKDIVSGDFYWFAESKYNKVLAAADCTGHGVPGGFMSMIGFAMLQETLLLEEMKTTSEAFTALDKKITESLNRNNRSYRDGMDMALCAFSKSSNTVQFSCANRPLILIRNGEAKDFSPDKYTIGGAIDNVSKNFRSQEIETEKGDMFYLFSDGYADQFGGPKEKKFMHKNFRETLLTISDKPLDEQKKILNETFENWKGNLEQVDDVLVIGIRI